MSVLFYQSSPLIILESKSMMRRAPFLVWFDAPACAWLIVAGYMIVAGCSGPILRPQSPSVHLEERAPAGARLISEVTQPYGTNYLQVEAVSLVTGLAGTGEDPPPSAQRAALLAEMNRYKVDNPNHVLASPDTALVLVRGFLRPGIQEGDRFDVEVRTPSRSDTSSLRSGWLMPTRLTELALLGNQIRSGHMLGTAEGTVLVDPSAESDDGAYLTQGRVLGGGRALKSRPLGLVLLTEHQSVSLSSQIGTAINRRFHMHVNGRQQGVATPKNDEFVDIKIHPSYKDNPFRYMRVLQNIAVTETVSAQQMRLQVLEQQLTDPLTAATAALRLEAIGNEPAIEVLKGGVQSSDPEVRFYAAEALAYLDETAAAEPLARAARDEPAFRVNALAALSAMDDVIAYDELRSLLEVSSAETRYGAFRALWAMNEYDPLVAGERLGDQFSYHVLDVTGPAMVHVTRSYRPEVVLFGTDQHLQLPLVLDAGKTILVNGQSGAQITVSRFRAGEAPDQRTVSTSLDEVIRAIVDLGGSYPDVVQALQQAKETGALASRFRVDALPEPGRSYARETEGGNDQVAAPQEAESTDTWEVVTPMPDLFSPRR